MEKNNVLPHTVYHTLKEEVIRLYLLFSFLDVVVFFQAGIAIRKNVEFAFADAIAGATDLSKRR